MTFLRRVKFVSRPCYLLLRELSLHMRSSRFWSYLSFLSRLSRPSRARRQRYANYFRVCIDNSLLCLSTPWRNCSDNDNCSDCFTILNKCKSDRLACSTKLEVVNSHREEEKNLVNIYFKFLTMNYSSYVEKNEFEYSRFFFFNMFDNDCKQQYNW